MFKNSIINYFWDNEKKAFINGYRINGEKDYRISHHAQYWGILTGLYPEENYNYLFDKIIPAIPFYKEEISYEKGYEFLAYIKAGRKKEIFTMLDEVWGDWLRQGNTVHLYPNGRDGKLLTYKKAGVYTFRMK